jgi:hypothetical protein
MYSGITTKSVIVGNLVPTNAAGGVYEASVKPQAPNTYTIQLGEIPDNASITAAWWVPTDNVAAIQHFALIDVQPAGEAKSIRLSAALFLTGVQMRVTLFAFWSVP